MSTHEQWLLEIRNKLVGLDAACSILVVGSIGRGFSRADSDIDMIVVTWRVQAVPRGLPWTILHTHFGGASSEQRLDTWDLSGTGAQKLDMLLITPLKYQRRVLGNPVINWGLKKILYDPSGIAAWGERCNRIFLEANPAVDLALTQWHQEYAAWKADRSRTLSIPPIQELQKKLSESAKPVECKAFADDLQSQTEPVSAPPP